MQSRKEFLQQSAILATGGLLLGFNKEQNEVYKSFDLHCHPGRFFSVMQPSNSAFAAPNKSLSEMKEVDLNAAFFALVADFKVLGIGPNGVVVNKKYQSGEAWEEYKRQLAIMKSFFNSNGLKETTLKKINKASSPAAFIAVEGGDFLEGNIDNIERAYLDGVRSIQLVHYAQNDIGDLQSAPPIFNGLSSFGKETVKKMNQLGMLIDVAHATFETTKAVANLTDAPIMLSHSILQTKEERPIAMRAISVEHAKIVAQTRGIIGAWPSGFNLSLEDYVDNIARLVDTVGIDHVGIGTDMDSNFKPVINSYKDFTSLKETFNKKGFSALEQDKIMGINATRVIQKVFKS